VLFFLCFGPFKLLLNPAAKKFSMIFDDLPVPQFPLTAQPNKKAAGFCTTRAAR
jgi:hypothetical protein